MSLVDLSSKRYNVLNPWLYVYTLDQVKLGCYFVVSNLFLNDQLFNIHMDCFLSGQRVGMDGVTL